MKKSNKHMKPNKHMKENKHIEREEKEATEMYDNRSLENDYRTLKPILKKGMIILDVGCGTGAISKDIAKIVGEKGRVIGIDNTKKFIESGKKNYGDIKNLDLIHSDLFDFQSEEKFDLIISARVLQWLTTPKEALLKMKELLKPSGQISILDYNHEALDWKPSPPKSMQDYYKIFLEWRKNAGMNNKIAEDLSDMMNEVGLSSIEVLNSNEHYERENENFEYNVGIWSKVASGLNQIVEEGYIENEYRQQVIEEYNEWVEKEAISMTMKLNEVRGKMPVANSCFDIAGI
jgi:ubiquinone/menaquinone biosynthesis C-methylase UbiE